MFLFPEHCSFVGTVGVMTKRVTLAGPPLTLRSGIDASDTQETDFSDALTSLHIIDIFIFCCFDFLFGKGNKY